MCQIILIDKYLFSCINKKVNRTLTGEIMTTVKPKKYRNVHDLNKDTLPCGSHRHFNHKKSIYKQPEDKGICNICQTEKIWWRWDYDDQIWTKQDIKKYGDGNHNLKDGDYICLKCKQKINPLN